jgi:signal transduction histidine kinase/DNA-binding NarL/FixJ family response regulator
LALQWRAVLRALLPAPVMRALDSELGHTLMLMTVTTPLLAGLLALLYQQSRRPLGGLSAEAELALQLGFVKLFAALLLLSAVVTWWLVLKHRSAQVAQEESNRQTALLVHEIESHRRTDLALQQAKQTADQASLAKTRYVSTISHELRTPLNSIIGYAQLLDEDASIPPHRKQAVSVIRRGGDHLLSLIEGTLDMARIESGKLALDVKPMRFTEGLDELARMFEQQAASKGIGFAYEPQGSLPAVVRADEKRLRQVLINVLGNAVKFTRAGQVTLRVSHRRDMAHIEVEDTGPGISADELAVIFEPFARGATQAGGTGLGLTISKMLTDLMGGEMTVSSTPGQGSVFRMRLFLPAVRAEVAQRELTRPPRTGYLGPRQRILVVDNEEVDRELLRQVLAPLGFEVHTAANGHDCLAAVAGVAPHALLMDLAMPGIDGWETIRRLRAQGLSDAPVAIVSANAFDRGLDNDVGITPADWVVKPVRREELLDWLGRALALDWTHADVPSPAPASATADTSAPATLLPAPELLQALSEQVTLGYFKGIHTALDRIEAAHPDHAPLVAPLRALARQFQLDGLAQRLALLTAPSP